MHFNPDKCFVMRLTHARNIKQFNNTLGNATLQETDSYIGICITKDLNWNKHIHQITASANRTLAFIRRNLHSCPINIKTSAYTTLVRPLQEYSSSVWHPPPPTPRLLSTKSKWFKDAQPVFVLMTIHLQKRAACQK